MNVILLGAGGMGRWAAQTAVSFKQVTRLTVADLHLAVAQGLANGCGPKAQVMELDVTNQTALLEALQAHDAVLNCVGPYYRFGLPTLKAAIEARCHYLDLCDGWEPTLDMLNLSTSAQEAGITAVIGLGASPGVTNLLAMKLAAQFDQVEELYTGWHVESAFEAADSHAAIAHWVHQFTGQIAVHENGRRQTAKPLEAVKLDYPGVGERTFFTLGHPEALTLPMALPRLKVSKNLMHMSQQTYEGILQLAMAVDEGQMTVEQAAALIAGEQMDTPTREDMIPAGSEAVPSLFAWARGTINGRREQRAASLRAFAPGMGGMTGIPLAVGLSLLAEGRLTKRGVLTPEEAFDPDTFLHIFNQYCSYPAPVTSEEFVHITTSTTL